METTTPPFEHDEVEELHDTANSIAFRTLEQYVTDNVLSAVSAEYYRTKYTKLHTCVRDIYKAEKEKMKRAKELNNSLLGEKIKLEKQAINKSKEIALSTNLEKEKEKALKEVVDCAERDSILSFELSELQRDHVELLRQKEELQQENANLVEPEIRRITEETAKIAEELHRTEGFIKNDTKNKEDYTERIGSLTQQQIKLDEEVVELRRELAKVRSDPDRIRKQADVIQKAVDNLENDVAKYKHKLTQHESTLSYQEKKHDEADEVQKELNHKLEIHRDAIEHNQREIDIEKSRLDEEKNKHHMNLNRRVELEWECKTAEDKVRREGERLNNLTTDFDRLKKLLKKKQMMADAVKGMLPNLQMQVKDAEHQVEAFKLDNKQKKEKQVEFKQEVDVFIAKFLKQEGVEKSRKEELLDMVNQVKKLELELSQWVSEEVKQNRIISMLNSQREIKAREASVASQNERETLQDLKMKELVILDLAKKCNETNNRLKEFSALYDVVKNERNKYVNLIQSSSQALAEMKEKIKILQNEVEVLRNESLAKDKALSKERLAHQTAQCSRDGLRLEANKCHAIYRIKQEQVEQQIVKIDKHNSDISAMEKEMLRLKKKYELAVDARNFTGVQLIDRNDELCILYEKSNIQKATLNQGEIQLREKDQIIRMLQIEIAEQKRRIQVVRKKMPAIPEFAQRILQLQNQLQQERQMTELLCRDAETPKNMERWRELVGEDPDAEQLQAKINILEERLNTKKEQLLEKELVLEEVTNLAQKLRNQAGQDRESTLKLSKEINDCQAQIKDITRKMMANVSELSMFQATALKLQQEKQTHQAAVEEAQWNLDEGRCPTVQAENEWYRLERERLHREEARFQKQKKRPMVPTQVTRTTAEPRPNAYIPDSLGIPKPYGKLAPFKPTEPGSSIRHIRKPIPKEIDI